MAANVPKGSVLQAGGDVVAPDPNSGICEAYALGLADWCKKGGDFNKQVFKHLKKKNSTLAKQLADTSERPIGVLTNRGPRGFAALARRGGAVGKAATAAKAAADGALTMAQTKLPAFMHRILMCSGVRGKLGGLVQIERVLCPDGLLASGRPLEIKRPTELQSHPDQLNNYAKCSPDGKCELVNCHTCNLDCKNWNSDCEGHP